MDKSTIKQEIIRYLEANGPKSKSKIEDYIRAEMGNNGDTISRRIRELVASDVLRKDQREYEGKKYWEYSVVEENHLPDVGVMVELPKETMRGFANHKLQCAISADPCSCEQTEKLNL